MPYPAAVMERTMGLHKLEIEVTDELLSRIDKVSAQTQHSRAQVVVETLKDHLPGEGSSGGPDRETIEKRRAFLKAFSERTAGLGPGRSQEEIDRQVREFREDRVYDR